MINRGCELNLDKKLKIWGPKRGGIYIKVEERCHLGKRIDLLDREMVKRRWSWVGLERKSGLNEVGFY